MFSIINGILSALSWGAGDFAGGLATRKLGPYRAVFYSDLLGLLALLVVNAFYKEIIPSTSSLMIAGIAGMCGSVGMMILYYSMARGQMSIAAPVSALFAAALPIIVGAFTQGFPTLIHFLGFGLALLAVWLISQGDTANRFHVDRLSDLRLPLLAGLGFGSYFIIMHYATKGISSTVWPMIVSRLTATLMLLGACAGTARGVLHTTRRVGGRAGQRPIGCGRKFLLSARSPIRQARYIRGTQFPLPRRDSCPCMVSS